MNFASQVAFHARSAPDAPALYFDDAATNGERDTTYGDLDGRANAFANLLEATGVDEGDRVAFFTPNDPAMVVGYVGCLKRGALFVPINQRYAEREVRFVLDDLAPTVLVTVPDLLDAVPEPAGTSLDTVYLASGGSSSSSEQFPSLDDALSAQPTDYRAVPRRNDAVANVMYTSGSTGDPKPVVHQHGFHHAVGAGRIAYFELDRTDVAVVVSPMFHVSGLGLLDMALSAGNAAVILPEWDADRFVAAVERHDVTYTHLITTVLVELADRDREYLESFDTGSLDVVVTGGGSLSPDRVRRFERLVGGTVCEGYSRTEGGFAYNRPGRRKLGSNGVPIYDINDLRVVDPETNAACEPGELGEIQVRGEGVTVGYYERPDLDEEAFLDDGWMHTGDLGRFDADGFLSFEGRQGGMIKSGGENVSPAEVEAVLQEVDGVAEAAVVGLPDDRWGERVAAAVVRSQESVTAADLEAYCRERLAGFKLPRTIVFVDELPKQSTQKVDRSAVVERILAADDD